MAYSALGRTAYAFAEDDIAARAYREAAALVEEFAGMLAPERAARFLGAPAIEEILSA